MRLIDADALVFDGHITEDRIDDGIPHKLTRAYMLAEQIERAPTIDAIPVVRCKDCKYFIRADYYTECDKVLRVVFPDDYCSRGERREKNGQIR